MNKAITDKVVCLHRRLKDDLTGAIPLISLKGFA